MIKQLIQLVMPKQLTFIGTALAIGSFVYGVADSRSRGKKVSSAQGRQEVVENAIRSEQAGRERRNQIRQSNTLQAQAEAVQFAQQEQGVGTGISNVSANVGANLGRNLGDVNTSLAGSSALSAARSNVLNAGRPSTTSLVNQQLQPLLFSNIDKLDTFFESAFTS